MELFRVTVKRQKNANLQPSCCPAKSKLRKTIISNQNMKKIFPSWHLTSVVLASFQVWMFLVFVCWMVLVLLHQTSKSTTTSMGRGEIVKVGSSCWVCSILFPTHTSVCITMLLPVYVLHFSLIVYIFYTSYTSVCIAMLIPSIVLILNSSTSFLYISPSLLPISISHCLYWRRDAHLI